LPETTGAGQRVPPNSRALIDKTYGCPSRPEGIESTAGAVAVGRGSRCCRRLSPDAGASVSALAPFTAAAHRAGLADLPHPALGQASREGMHGASLPAQPVQVDHPQFAVLKGCHPSGRSAPLPPSAPKGSPVRPGGTSRRGGTVPWAGGFTP
jgi:hypothetical protein